jgi:hypothetical protein
MNQRATILENNEAIFPVLNLQKKDLPLRPHATAPHAKRPHSTSAWIADSCFKYGYGSFPHVGHAWRFADPLSRVA